MITDNQDQLLQSAFAEARQDLEDETLTKRIMAKTRRVLYMLAAGVLTIAVVLITTVWLVFGMPLLEFAVLISQFLTMTLIDLGIGFQKKLRCRCLRTILLERPVYSARAKSCFASKHQGSLFRIICWH